MRRFVLGALLALLSVPSWADPKEDALRKALVGKYVTVKIDMPASHRGVDLRFDKDEPFNPNEHFSRVREYDAAIREGDRAQITHVKLKDDMIELHLAGGGFNWSSDKTTQTFSSSSKTARESELERQIKAETDRTRKRDLQTELDDLRRQRERRDERRKREMEEYNIGASERDRARALRSGSRFNLRFKKDVPDGALSGEGVFDYLTKWVAISNAPAGGGTAPRPGRDLGFLRKGLLRSDVDRELGRPRTESSCKSGDTSSDCRLAIYASGADDVEVTYVEDVVVKFTIRRR